MPDTNPRQRVRTRSGLSIEKIPVDSSAPEKPSGHRQRSTPKGSSVEQRTKGDRPVPTMGLPAAVYKVNKLLRRPDKVPKLSKKEKEHLAVLEWRRQMEEERSNAIKHLRALCEKVKRLTVCFVNTKGAAATTTTTVHMASVTGDVTRSVLVVADFNPAAGTSAQRLGRDHGETVTLRGLLQSMDAMTSFTDFIDLVRPTPYNVRAISADSIIRGNQELSGADAEKMLELIQANCEYLLLDTANDIATNVSKAVVKASDVIVFTANVQEQDSLRQLATSMETLREQGFADKVDRSVVVISNIPPGKTVDDYRLYLNQVNLKNQVVRPLESHFRGQMLGIPHDPVIARAEEVNLGALHWGTFMAYLYASISMYQQAPQFWDNPSAANFDG